MLNNVKFWFLLVLLLGCNHKKIAVKITTPNSNLSVPELVGKLNDITFPDSAILIWRYGSVEWSEEGSLIVINKPLSSEKTEIQVSYYEIYDGLDDFGRSYCKYDFSLKTKYNTFQILSQYLYGIEEKVNQLDNTSEGNCGNRYVVEKIGIESLRQVSSMSNFKVIECIKELFRQISPKEYFQSLAIEKNCFEQDSIKYQMYFGKFPDSIFQIPFSECVPIYGGKPLEKRILPSGKITYVLPVLQGR